MKTLALAALLLTSSPLLAQRVADRLVGTWLLETIETRTADGQWRPAETRFGQNAVGILIYDASGNMSVQVMRRDRASIGVPGGRVSEEELARASPERKAEALDGYTAYWGTYMVDEDRSVVIHQRQGHLIPDQAATPAEREFELRDDLLILHSPGGPNYLAWRRQEE